MGSIAPSNLYTTHTENCPALVSSGDDLLQGPHTHTKQAITSSSPDPLPCVKAHFNQRRIRLPAAAATPNTSDRFILLASE